MRKQKKYTVRYEPTGAARGMMRAIGVLHAVFGTVFALAAITTIIPSAGLIGLLFLAAGVFFAVNGTLIALGKNGLIGRSYRIETDMEQEPEDGGYVPSSGLDAKKRLEQLESLKEAGLISEQEYREKRQEILREL